MERTALLGRLSWQLGEVVATQAETARTKSITLTLPTWPGHRAGQHVDVRLTAEDGYQAERSYSIASPPEEQPRVTLTVERLDDGEVSPTSPRNCASVTSWSCADPLGATSSGRRRWGGRCCWSPGAQVLCP